MTAEKRKPKSKQINSTAKNSNISKVKFDFKNFFTYSNDLLCIADTNGFFRLLNPEWEPTLGYPVSELVGKKFIDFVHPDDVKSTIDVTSQLAENKTVQNFVNRYKHKNGSWVWIEWRSYPKGKYIYASARNITGHKQTEEALLQSEQKYRLLFENITSGFVLQEMLYDKKGLPVDFRFIEVNSRFKEILNLKGEFVGKTFFESFSNAGPEWIKRAQNVLKTHEPYNSITLFPNGRYFETLLFWVETNRFASIFTDITDRIIAEQKLKQSEEHFRNLVTNANVVNFAIDKNGIFTLSEGKTLEKLGLQPGEIVGRSVFEVYKDNPDITDAINKGLNGESVERIICQNNLFFESRFTPLINENSEIIGVLGVAIDITDRKLAETALIESEKKYRLLFENMTSGFALHQMIYDENGKPADYRYIEANPAFEKLTGLPAQAIIGKTIKEIVPTIEDHWIQTFGNVALTGNPITYMNYARDLGRYYDTYVFSPEKDKYAVVFNDATERIKAENELKASEQKFSNFYNLSLDMVGITRLSDGLVLDANPAMIKETGYSHEELIGHSSLDLNLWANPNDRDTALKELKEKGEIKNFEIRMKIKNGSSIPCLFSAKTLTYNNEPCLLFVLNDISDRIIAENKIRESEKKYRLLFENLTSAFAFHSIIFDENKQPVDFIFIDINSKYKQLWGVDDSIIGKKISEVFPNFEKKWVDDAWKVLESGQPEILSIYSPELDKYLESFEFKVDDKHFAIIFNDITEKVKADKALQETRKFNDALLASTPGLVYLYNEEGLLVRWNNRHIIETGYSAEELSHMHVLDWYKGSEADITAIKAGLDKVFSEGFGTAEAYLQKKNGEKVLYYFTAVSTIIEGKNYFTGIAIDITERKIAEDALANTVETLQVIIKNVPIALFDLDLKGNIMSFWNPAAEELLGWTKEEVLGKYLPTVTPEKVEEFDQFLLTIQQGKTVKGMDVDRIRKNGNPVSYSLYATPLFDNKGIVKGNIAALVDITERKQANEKFKKLADLNQTVLDTVSTGIIFVNNHELQWANNTFYKMFGYTVEEKSEIDLANIYANFEDTIKVGNESYPIMTKGEVYSSEFLAKKKDGNTFWMNLSGKAIDPTKQTEGYIWTLQDITERKNSEEKFKQLALLHQTILDTVTVGLLFIVNHKSQWSNTVYTKMFNTEIIEVTLSDIVYSSVDNLFEIIGNEANPYFTKGEIYSSELKFRRKDDSIFWCNLVGKTINPNDFSEGSIWMMQDITIGKNAELNLKQSESILKATMESMNDGLLIVTDQNIITHYNTRFKQIFSVPDELLYTLKDETVLNHAKLQLADPEEFYQHVKHIYQTSNTTEDILHFVDGRIIERYSYPLTEDSPKRGRVWLFRDITEKRNAELTLKKSEEQFKGIAQNIPGMVFQFYARKNGDFGLNYASERSMEYIGYNNIELTVLFKQFVTGIIEEDRKRFISSIQDSITNITDWKWEGRFIRQDGKQMYFQGISKPRFIDEDLVFDGLVLDITERRNAEEALIKSQAMLRDSQRIAHIGCWEVDILSKKMIWNEEAYEIHGYKNNEIDLTWDKFVQIIHPEDREATTIHFREMLTSHRFDDFECRIIRPDSIQRIIVIVGALSVDENNQPNRAFGIVQDITERKIAEEKLRQSEELYRNLVEMSPDGIFLSDLKGTLLVCNKQMATLAGYDSVEQIIGRSSFDFVAPEDHELVKKVAEELRKSGVFGTQQMKLLKKDGTQYIAEYRGALISDFKGAPTAFMGVITDITEKRKAEETLMETQERLQSFMDSATDAFTIWDKDLHLVLFNNPAFANLPKGIRTENIVGHNLLEFTSFLVKNNDVNKFFRVLKTGIPFSDYDQLCMIPSDPRWINLRVFKVGQGLGIITTDITEQKRAEIILSEKEAKLRSIFLAAPVAIGLSINRVCYECNDTFFTMTGYSPEEIIGKNTRMLYQTEEEYLRVGYSASEKIKINKPLIKETRWVRKDGSIIDIILGSVALDPTDSSKGITFTALDISERKQFEDALKKRVLALTRPLSDAKEIELTDLFNIDDLQKIQDTFAEATNVASVITYPDGQPITKTSNFCTLCNLIRSTEKGRINCYKSDSYLGKQNPSGPTIQPCLSGGLWDAGASITIGGVHIANWLIGQVRNEIQHEDEMIKYADEIGIDREVFLKELRKVPSMSKEQFEKVSNALYILASELSLKAYQNVQQARFITEQKIAEEEIKKLNTELEQRVDERTYKLNEALKDLESFSYSVSHDLRAPIRHIDGFTKLLFSKITNPSEIIVDYQKKIELATKRMSSMIDSLLSFSRLGRKELTVSKFEIAPLIEEIINQFKPDISNRQIEWEIEALTEVTGDRNLLKLAFENLISNSIKYTSKVPVAIIKISAKELPDDITEICIKDNGVGFDMQFADKLFGVFQRLHSSDEFEGIGIGLANVKQIIEKHNGTIRAEGKVNEGALFYIKLPK